jgi:hypothetical protein
MKTFCLLFIVALGIGFAARGSAQEKKTTEPAPAPGAATSAKTTNQVDLEAAFKAALANVTFSGRWCSVKDGQLGPEKEDKYTILSVSKVGGDMWLINARIQYGDKNIVAPIPVQVKWAGDTPVIILDKISIPGGGTYSARVLIFEKTYAGTWSGGDHAGLLNGLIKSNKEN